MDNANKEDTNSRELTNTLKHSIIKQEHRYAVSENEMKNFRSSMQEKEIVKQKKYPLLRNRNLNGNHTI